MDASISNTRMTEWVNKKKQKLQEEKRHEITYLEFSRYLGIPAQTIMDWFKRPDYTFGGLHQRNKEKLRKLFPDDFGQPMNIPPKEKKELEKSEQFIMPILENDYTQRNIPKYAYAQKVLNMPIATFQKWMKENYRFSQLSEKYQRLLAEKFPDRFDTPAKQDIAASISKSAAAKQAAPFNALPAAIIVQYEVSKLVPLFEKFLKGTEDDRKALRALFNENEWYNFMNMVQALSSEQAQKMALQEKRIQFTDSK